MITILLTALTLLALLTSLRRSKTAAAPPMLMADPRQCVLGFRRIAASQDAQQLKAWYATRLPALTAEDRL